MSDYLWFIVKQPMNHVLVKWIIIKNQNNSSFSNARKQDFLIFQCINHILTMEHLTHYNYQSNGVTTILLQTI
jgi:hypothetical protein